MLGCPSSIDLSSHPLRYPTGQLRARQREIGTRWRRLLVGRQALLAPAHWRCGDTCAQLAAGFRIGVATAYRYTREAIEDVKCWADKAHQGASRPTRVPFRGRRLKRWKRRHNSTHARTRCPGEQAMAALKGWCPLRKPRRSTHRITDIVKAVVALHHAST